MHRYICTECGAYLDPGEHCDCKRRFEEKKEIWKNYINQDLMDRCECY